MSLENMRNRDIFLKFCFMYFLNHILIVLGIDEKVIDMLPTGNISFKKTGKVKIFDNLYDFKALTDSGKIIIFEFKKDTLRTQDLKQSFEYYTREFCKNGEDVELIMIVLSKGGKINEYVKLNLTFHPKIIKTKKINKQEDLNAIENKFDNNEMITVEECSLLIALPLFELNESEADVVKKTCKFIKFKKDYIPSEKLDELVIGSYLNIVEYVEVDKQYDLMEMIGMAKKAKGVLAMYKEEMKRDEMRDEIRDEMRDEIAMDFARKLKGKISPDEITQITGLSLATVLSL